MRFPRAIELARNFVSECLSEGDIAVDATCGNGHDTIWLIEAVGSLGTVIGFDIQQEAIDLTWERTKSLDNSDRLTLIRSGHEDIVERLVGEGIDSVKAVVFNLGYLPNGDKLIKTEAASTIRALEGATGLLDAGGVISIVIYSGHPGGESELHAVGRFATGLNQDLFEVVHYRFTNQKNSPPELVLICRIK